MIFSTQSFHCAGYLKDRAGWVCRIHTILKAVWPKKAGLVSSKKLRWLYQPVFWDTSLKTKREDGCSRHVCVNQGCVRRTSMLVKTVCAELVCRLRIVHVHGRVCLAGKAVSTYVRGLAFTVYLE